MVSYTANLTVFPAGEFLTGKGANSTSQFGEDGLIAAALERFGEQNRWCFEVGAHDGCFLSNTHRLRCLSWDAVLIEADAEQFEKLRLQASNKVRTIPKRIGLRCLDGILSECGAPQDIDLGIIDIDGQDYWAWDGLREFEPRLMLVEFEYGSDDHPPRIVGCGEPGQSNCKAIEQLGVQKGYVPLAKTPCNLLFVKSELL
jgi:hypothetical protein